MIHTLLDLISNPRKGLRSIFGHKVMESTSDGGQPPQNLPATGYLWIPKRELRGKGPQPYYNQINPVLRGMTDSRVFYPWSVKPRIMWSLIDYQDPNVPPELQDDNVILGKVNSFREFEFSDYDCFHNALWFRSRFTDGGHWVMLEF